MDNQLQKFSVIMNQFSYLTVKPMLVGVSGGIDSVVLLHLLLNNGCTTEIAHCNFSLRGEESDGDEQFVKSFAEKYNIPYHIRKFATAQFAEENGISVQMAARRLRVEFMNELYGTGNFSCICLAHHLDDNIETFFLNLQRGTGIRGLKGMNILSGKLFKPLLEFSRAEITEYAVRNNLEYREDSSNKTDDYQRNRIRHHVIPAMNKALPEFSEMMKDNLRRISCGIFLYDEFIQAVENEAVFVQNNTIIVHLQKLQKFKNAATLLGEIISKYGFTHLQAQAMLDVKKPSETATFKSDSHIAYVKSGKAEFTKPGHEKNEKYIIENLQDFHKVSLPLRFYAQIVPRKEILEIEHDSSHAYFDFSKITFPLKLRKWKTGDSFRPFGMNGKKLLSDYFTDLKLSALQKQNTWLLCSNDTIIWIIGFRTNDLTKVTGNTSKILHLTLL